VVCRRVAVMTGRGCTGAFRCTCVHQPARGWVLRSPLHHEPQHSIIWRVLNQCSLFIRTSCSTGAHSTSSAAFSFASLRTADPTISDMLSERRWISVNPPFPSQSPSKQTFRWAAGSWRPPADSTEGTECTPLSCSRKSACAPWRPLCFRCGRPGWWKWTSNSKRHRPSAGVER